MVATTSEPENRSHYTDPSKRLRITYIAALLLVAGLTAGSQLYVQTVVGSQAQDAPVINKAGRQRMLSQKISKAALEFVAQENRSREAARRELQEAMDLWEDSQKELRFGDEFHRRATDDSDILVAFAELQPHMDAILQAGRELTSTESSEADVSGEVRQILRHEQEFLPKMHAIVGTLDQEAQQHVHRLQWIELLLMCITIAVLAVEAVLVFEPAARLIRKQFVDAIESSRELAKAGQLAQDNEQLRIEIENRKKVEDDLKAKNEDINKLTLIASRTRHSIIVTDPECRIEYVNEAFTKMTGYTAAEVIGERPGKFLQGAATNEEARGRIRQAIANREHIVLELINYTRDGNPYWVELEIEPVFNDAGDLIHFLGTQVDISGRKAHENAIEESEEKFRSLFETSRDAMVVLTDERLVDCNEAAVSMFKARDRDSLLKQTPETLSPPQQSDGTSSIEAVRREIEAAKTRGKNRFEWRHRRMDGTEFDAEVLLSACMVQDGSALQGTIRDISKRKYDKAALLDAKMAAEDANRAKSEFLANMSHEIRTPLNSILGYTDVLRRRSNQGSQNHEYLATIHSSGKHLLSLIDDILDLSKIEAGKMEFERVRCCPHRIIREVVSVLRVKAIEKGLKLDTHWRSGVPETVVTDPARLRQLLMNIVGNAIKFTDSGEVTICASIDFDGADPRFAIDVIDTGIGMSPEQMQRIFSPFDQADSSITRRFGGTGLGLAISRLIAEGLGGEINVTSTPNQGTTFHVRIATGSLDGVATHTDEQMESISIADSANPESQDHEASQSLKGVSVLLCEDGEVNRELINLVLNDSGAEVKCVENGKLGIEAVEESLGAFDVILMDMQMPVLDGYKAARALRDQGWSKPIIALTAHAMRGDRQKCLDAGCSGYLTKPIDIDELITTVSGAFADGDAILDEGSEFNDRKTSSSQLSPSDEDASPIHSTLPMDRPQILEIVQSFVEKLESQLSVMKEAFESGDFEQLAELAHWLKGAGGTIGYDCFTQPSCELEIFAKNCDRQGAERCLQNISALVQRIGIPLLSDAETRG